LGTVLGFEELLGNGNFRFAANDFNFLVLKGRETLNVNSERFREYLFAEEGGFYVFKLAFIPSRAGVFRIGLSDASNVYTVNNPCDRTTFLIRFKETNQHLYYNQWNYGVTPTLPNGVYCFKVK